MSETGWDTATRGVQMANPEGQTIFKYQLPVLERFNLDLPEGAEILRVDTIDGKFWLWAKVDLRKETEIRQFAAFKTGADIPDGLNLRYVGLCTIFVQMELGLYIFEVLE